jgi:translocon-associated protein subunit alpha
MRLFSKVPHILMLAMLVMPMIMSTNNAFTRAEEDELEEEEEGVVEEEGAETSEETTDDATEEDDGKKTTSPDADTTILFTKPPGTSNLELPAGQITEFLVGFTNKGEQEMIVDSLEASLRYPMDFTFHIQNFSAISYAKTVKSKQQATVAYSFIPADAFAGRPIGLTINLNYRDAAGNFFIDPVFNETVQIVEFDEGFDTETFFMYVCIFGATVLLLFLAFNFLSGKKGGSRPKPVETGTDDDGVDYEWIPKSALRTPGSGKTSPRQRKAKRGAGSDSE